MQVRKFNIKDQPAVKEFVLGVLGEFKFSYNPELDYDLEDPDKYYKNQGGIFYVLEVNNRIVGTIAVKNKDNGIAEIKRLYIDKDHRGKSYGSKLFDKALMFCKDNNFTRIILDTWTRFETAKLLYLSRGFKITSTREEQIFMEKELQIKVDIRLFKKGDAQKLSKMIYKAVAKLEKENPTNNYELVYEEDTPEELIKASVKGRMWIALSDHQIVGTLSLENKHLRRFFVHPEFQGRGIGRQLVNKVVEYARNNNIKEILVGAILSAVPIYKKLGFSEGKIRFEPLINMDEMEMRFDVS